MIQNKTIRAKTIQYNTIQYNTPRDNTIQNFSILGYEEDEAEEYKEPNAVVEKEIKDGKAIWQALNGRGRRTLKVVNKQKNDFFCNLSNAFLKFNSLLPSNLEIGIRLYLTSFEKYFTTTNPSHKPIFKILDAKLLVEFILLKPVLLKAMESRLAKSFLQINFLAKFVKSFR